MPHAEEIAGQEPSGTRSSATITTGTPASNHYLLQVWADGPFGVWNVLRLEVNAGAQIENADFTLTAIVINSFASMIANSGADVGAALCTRPSEPMPPAKTWTSHPICFSQWAVHTARTSVSSQTTIRAPRTPIQRSVACTNCPPGACRLSGR